MIEKIKKIINPKDFLIEENIIFEESQYENAIKNLCNNACAFMYIKFLDELSEEELSDIVLHNGYYENEKNQHSWFSYKKDNIILDLTLKQFNDNYDKFYIGAKPKELIANESIDCDDFINISYFFKNI